MSPPKKLGLLLLTLLIAAAVGLFTLHRIGLNKLASRGGGTIPTADELVYPDLTDDENAAILYRAAWNTFDKPPDGLDEMLLLNYGDTILQRMGLGREPDQVLTDSDIQILDVLMIEADPAYEILRQVRDTKGCLFLTDHSPAAANQNAQSMSNSWAIMRALTRKVKARAIWEAEQGNTDVAHDWLTIGLHMANDLNDESTVLGEVMRQAFAGIILYAAQGTLYNHPVSEATRQAMLLELNELRDRRHFGDGLRREAVLFEAMAPQYRGAWSPLLVISEGNYLDTHSRFIIAVEEEDYAKRKRQVDALREQSNASDSFVRKYTDQYESLGFLLMANETFDTFTAQWDLLELALALRAYEQTHGAFPATLADLTPEFLPALPQDPLNGKAYRYEKTAERITIRSEETTENGDEIAFHLAPLAQATGAPEGQ